MPKILDFTTPTGQHGNVLKPMTWVPLIIGGVVLLGTFAAAERVGKAVSGKLPFINTNPTNPFAQPVVNQSQKNYIG